MTSFNSAIYKGRVRHTRTRPVSHKLEYRVYYGWFDIDELDKLDRELRLFSLERFNLFGFSRRDHGPDDGSSLRSWATATLGERGIDLEDGHIMLLAHPRVLGQVFNPISVWYCYNAAGQLTALIHEVRNTFGDKHCYVVAVEGNDLGHEFEKKMHVSPFNDLSSTYRFSLNIPGERLTLSIDQHDDEGSFLRAGLALSRIPLTDSNLFRLFWSHPLLTAKVVTAIHWEAIRLWIKGARYHRHPTPPMDSVTHVGTRSMR